MELTMHVIKGRNVQQILPQALDDLLVNGVTEDTRNGPAYVYPTPVTTAYSNPAERVIFYAERDANPFFHLFESLWMLAGRNDVAYPAGIVSTMKNYSDDGKKFNGAYGYRWRNHFGVDQILKVVRNLKENPTCRRQVIAIYDGDLDTTYTGKDVPCNLTVHFQYRGDLRLDMTVFNRSNDVVWGCYGANAVHFSYLHELVARASGLDVGTYYQVSDNWHGYHSTVAKVEHLRDLAANGYTHRALAQDPYEQGRVTPFPLITTDLATWFQDLDMFMAYPEAVGFRDAFFRKVAKPMWFAHRAYKTGNSPERFDNALEIMLQVRATDWQLAGIEWLLRRKEASEKKVAA
jgi:hypothetical protein